MKNDGNSKNYEGQILSIEMVVNALIAAGKMDEKIATEIISNYLGDNRHPLIIIAEERLNDKTTSSPLTLESLSRWLAQYLNLEYVKIDPFKINVEKIIEYIPQAYAQRLNIMPTEFTSDTITIATADPFNTSWTSEIENRAKRKIKLVFSNPLDIKKSITDFFAVYKTFHKNKQGLSIKEQSTELTRSAGKIKELEKMAQKYQVAGKQSQSDNHMEDLADWLIQSALDERASDIHLEPKSDDCLVRFRIDGILRKVTDMNLGVYSGLLNVFKIMAKMKIDEKRRPQDGRIKRTVKNEVIVEMRLATIPTPHGESLTIRIFNPDISWKNVSNLGFYKKDYQLWLNLITLPYGIIFVTGPTGSGKTTTLYASLKELSSSNINICTIEDPIEMVEESFRQMEVNTQLDITFHSAIKAFLRQDPDIIMVGEIRDLASAEMAIQASLTGHLVFSTLHTNNAISSITRLLDLGVADYLINSSVKGILAQRLLRTLCPACKKKIPIDDNLWEHFTKGYQCKKPDFIFGAGGCPQCKQSGYVGRMMVYELMLMDDQIKDLLKKHKDISLLENNLKGKYMTLKGNAIRKVVEGVTTIEEVISNIDGP